MHFVGNELIHLDVSVNRKATSGTPWYTSSISFVYFTD